MLRDYGFTFWGLARARAWQGTREVIGFSTSGLLLGILCVVLAAGLHTFLATSQAALEQVWLVVVYGAPWPLLAVGVFSVKLFSVARQIYEEQQEEVKRLEDALAAYGRQSGLAQKLVELRREAVALRNRTLKKGATPALDALQIAAWQRAVDDWEARVLAAIKGQVSAGDFGRFETLDTYPPRRFSWQINFEHGRLLSMLSRRIEILLEIMAKF